MLPPSSDISNINVQFGFKIKNGVQSRTEQNEKKNGTENPTPTPQGYGHPKFVLLWFW